MKTARLLIHHEKEIFLFSLKIKLQDQVVGPGLGDILNFGPADVAFLKQKIDFFVVQGTAVFSHQRSTA
jgi:hypothetical protein